MNKAEFIRAHADMAPADLLAYARKAGLEVTPKYISNVLGAAKRRAGKRPTRKIVGQGGISRADYSAVARETAALFAKHGAALSDLGKFLTSGAGDEFSPSVRSGLESFVAASGKIAEAINRMHDITVRRGHTYFAEQASAWDAGEYRAVRKADAAE